MASPALLPTAINDLVVTTLRDLGRDRYTEIATNLQKHTAMKRLFQKNRVELTSGYGIQWDVKVTQTGAASNVGLGYQDVLNDVDTMVQATADWRNTQTNYSLIGQVVDMNREPSRIVDYIKSKRVDALISLAELMERNFWGPPVAVTDNVTPWGINTWLVKNATRGFNGGAPSGFTTIGLNPTTYPNWNNYTDQYTNVTNDDLMRKMRMAATLTGWEPPVDGIPTFNTGNDYGFFTNYGVIGPAEELLMSQNDNLGHDVADMDGTLLFRSSPVVWVPALEADTTNPVYGINFGLFKTFVLKNWWLRETNVPIYPGQHTVSAHFMDCTYQMVMRSRREHFVIATGTTYPS